MSAERAPYVCMYCTFLGNDNIAGLIPATFFNILALDRNQLAASREQFRSEVKKAMMPDSGTKSED